MWHEICCLLTLGSSISILSHWHNWDNAGICTNFPLVETNEGRNESLVMKTYTGQLDLLIRVNQLSPCRLTPPPTGTEVVLWWEWIMGSNMGVSHIYLHSNDRYYMAIPGNTMTRYKQGVMCSGSDCRTACLLLDVMKGGNVYIMGSEPTAWLGDMSLTQWMLVCS